MKTKKHQHTKQKSNFGFDRYLPYALKQALIAMYGPTDHYYIRYTHAARFTHFIDWLQAFDGTRDARKITVAHIQSYNQEMKTAVENGELSVAYAQNLLSTLNVVMQAFRKDDHLWI